MKEIFIQPSIKETSIPDLSGKRLLIIGGTHGIGESLATLAIDLGAQVTVVGRTVNPELDCTQVLLDVDEHIDDLEPLFEDKDYVFNNIGIYEKNTIEATSRDRLQEVLRVNIEIMFLLTQYSVRHALGVVVNMASRPTLEKYHSWGLYTLSKQAVITITQAAAEESSAKFYAVCPSRVDTRFRESVFPGEDKATRLSPEEVARVILTLFNGSNPTGSHYWLKKPIPTSSEARE